MIPAEDLPQGCEGEALVRVFVDERQRAQGPQEPIEQPRIYLQLRGHVARAGRPAPQGLEEAQLDSGIQDLAAPAPKNQVKDLGLGVLHTLLLVAAARPETPQQAMGFPSRRGRVPSATLWSSQAAM